MKRLIKVPLVFLLLVAFSSNYVVFANRLAYGRLSSTVTTEKKTTAPSFAKVVVRKTEPLKNSRVSRPIASNPTKNSPKKRSIASATKEVRPCLAASEENNCFTDCLKSWDIPPEAISECASQCAGGNYGTCAACLGVAVFIVAYCAYQCAPLETRERLPKKLQSPTRNRSNTLASNRVPASRTQRR